VTQQSDRPPADQVPAHPATADQAPPKKGTSLTIGNLAVLLVAVGLAAVGQLMLKHGMNDAKQAAHENGRSLAVAAASSPWVIFGLGVFAVSALAWLLTLSRVPLSVAYPFNAVGYLGILIVSVAVLHERANVWTWLGTLLVVGGLVLVVTMAPGSS
jgi:multidrug transporter EmrE-like cation transporter